MNTIIITCNDYTLEEVLPLLEYLKHCGDIGHSTRVSIDDKKFFFDGDGASGFNDLIVNGESRTINWLRERLTEKKRIGK